MSEILLYYQQQLQAFQEHLYQEEKSHATIGKYMRDARAFFSFVNGGAIVKEVVLGWKQHLQDSGYAVRSINSMLASVNSMLDFLGLAAYKVKSIRQQKAAFCKEEEELTKEEYRRLLHAARKNEQLELIMQTICATGIRVSELQYFTVEAVQRDDITVYCKGKVRVILIPSALRKRLLSYAKKKKIRSGIIFTNRNGNVLSRSYIWRKMKELCIEADVNLGKVYPHNLRKLFARTFYGIEKDIAKLADILGHSSINTTRIYIMSTGWEHRKKIEQMGLVFP